MILTDTTKTPIKHLKEKRKSFIFKKRVGIV